MVIFPSPKVSTKAILDKAIMIEFVERKKMQPNKKSNAPFSKATRIIAAKATTTEGVPPKSAKASARAPMSTHILVEELVPDVEASARLL